MLLLSCLLRLWHHVSALWRHTVWIRIVTSHNAWMGYEYSLPKHESPKGDSQTWSAPPRNNGACVITLLSVYTQWSDCKVWYKHGINYMYMGPALRMLIALATLWLTCLGHTHTHTHKHTHKQIWICPVIIQCEKVIHMKKVNWMRYHQFKQMITQIAGTSTVSFFGRI